MEQRENAQDRTYIKVPANMTDEQIRAWAIDAWERMTGLVSAVEPEGADAYSPKFIEALAFASALHRTQRRKGTSVPYVSHLLAVAALVWEAGGDETEAIAGLLHDAAEDQGGVETLKRIRASFGADVAHIVAGCSDATPAPGESKPPWRQRKEHHIKTLASADRSTLLVSVCDKIHNGESIVNDLNAQGDAVWDRFNASPKDILWYYTSILDLAGTCGSPYAFHRLRNIVDRLGQAVASQGV